jgi:hypothetical protein
MTSGPSPNPSPGNAPATPPATPPAKKGMSGGVKVLIGCAIFVVLVGVAGTVALGLGARFIGQKAQEFAGSVERHAEATQTIERLNTRYPFEPPADDVVRPDRATAFFGATDLAWDRARPAWEELKRRAERADERGRAGIGDVVAGVSGIHELTLALASALEAHDMSPAEYVWTGVALKRAHEALEANEDPDWIPAGNIQLARRHQQQLAELAVDDERGGLVLGFAMMYGGLAGMEGWFRHLDTER